MAIKESNIRRLFTASRLSSVLVFCGHIALGQPSATEVNNFPIALSVEAFAGRPVRVASEFNLFFPVDDTRYIPIREPLAELLSSDPIPSSERGMRVRVLSTKCSPRQLDVLAGQDTAQVEGASVRSVVEISPQANLPEGLHDIVLSYPIVDLAFGRLGAKPLRSRAEVHLSVKVWTSPESRMEAQRLAEQEARRKEQELERQRKALEEQHREQQRRALLMVGKVGLVVLLLGLVLLGNRGWIWPTVAVSVRNGDSCQCHFAVPALARERGAEPGSILSTSWAHGWAGGRQRIKVETLAAEDTAPTSEGIFESVAFGDQGQSRAEIHKLDVLVSTGQSVKPGSYLAALPNGRVRVKVAKHAPR